VRLAEIAVVHADAGADLVLPSGMLEGSVRAVRAALSGVAHGSVPVASMIKLESRMYASHRRAVEAVPVAERAVPLIAPEDRDGARARAVRDVASGADAVVVKPGLATQDLVSLIASAADRPVLSFFTADEHALFAANEALPDAEQMEREGLISARRAGADLLITYGRVGAEA
jgi:porphobilinogen synthase